MCVLTGEGVSGGGNRLTLPSLPSDGPSPQVSRGNQNRIPESGLLVSFEGIWFGSFTQLPGKLQFLCRGWQ